MQPNDEGFSTSSERSEEARRQQAEDSLWIAFQRMYRGRRTIFGVTIFVAVASVVISLLLPNWYRSSARVLIPDAQGPNISSALLGNLPAAASALLGGGPAGDYTRYLAILTSRNMMVAAVDSFDLISVYETGNEEFPLEEAIEKLEDNVDFEIDMEYEFLSISVLDRDPERAADMANFFVRRLNDMNARLSTESASNYRRSVEKRYLEARAAIDSVLNAAQQFQREHGVYDLPSQTEVFFEQIGMLRQRALEIEIQYEALRAQFGPDNAQVQAMREVAEAANRKYQAALDGQEQLLPVAQSEVPDVARQYMELELEGTIQRTILEVIGPMYEQARFQEERQAQAVQVLDDGVVPSRKAKPKRAIICILATLSALLLAVIFVLVYEWWREHHADFLRRLQADRSVR
ncbi:MAG: Wzz/FepE/Etk N-terminal domain-containing protein [Rhodothermales bacterium]